ncbi:winged helix DNA-binding domain-containing protein [Isoptericola sp. NPDC057653]|uniref:winged helix DNA-binding domain-containing protein n=1 Tax=Isoptericola sp. NPDC057653 TaxID=3346195 RepID=UPI0036B0524A
MTARVTRDDVVAFRLAAHGLAARAPAGDLAVVAGRCGVQDSPPGSALLALHARAEGVTREGVDAALGEERSLLRTWAMRGAPCVVPTADAAAFTAGVLPPAEEARRHLLLGVGPSLDRLGLSLTDAVDLTRAELRGVLAGRRLAIGELGAELAARIAPGLPSARRAVWEAEGPYAAGQPLGEGVVHFCLRVLTLEGVLCFAPRDGNQAPFVLVDEWLGHPLPEVDPAAARADLLRRYLHCYGPTTRAAFATWAGVRAGDVGPWWDEVADELAPVEVAPAAGGRASRGWLLADDVDALASAAMPTGVRLLPPRDPYTQLRDRATIVAKEHHRAVWAPVGDPGTVLVDGEVAGTWRPRAKGSRLTLAVTTFGRLPDRATALLNDEAVQVAALRGSSTVDVELTTA